jgi:phosphatidylinositol alpha-1,6-mannosyltransferase
VKCLFLCQDFPPWGGGLSQSAYEYARGLHALGHEVVVVTPRQTPDDDRFDQGLPFPVIRLRNIKDHLLKMYYVRWSVGRIRRQFSFDVAVAHTWYPFGIACADILRGETPFAVMAFGNDFLSPRFQKRFWKPIMFRAFNSAARVCFITEFTRKRFSSLGFMIAPEKETICYPGIDPMAFQPGSKPDRLVKKHGLEGAFVLLTLGRLVERKGQDQVLEALSVLKETSPDVTYRYLICGGGPDEGRLRTLVQKYSLEREVIFAGYVSDEQKADYYNVSDVYLMLSRERSEQGDVEGFGLTFLEAGACEKPVIGGRSGGVPEAVVDQENGFLVDPVAPKELAERIDTLARNADIRNAMGARGRHRVLLEFNTERAGQRLVRCLEECLSSGVGGGRR